jgi:predicted esterase
MRVRRLEKIVMTTVLLVGCASPTATVTPAHSAAPTLTPSPSPTPATPSPAAIAPSFEPIATETADGVTVTDLIFDGGHPTSAYLVVPDGGAARSARGVLWFHWLEGGSPTSDRTEFLEEAKALAASDGVVSLLVDGTFPWRERPESVEHDMAAVEADLTMLGAAYELLMARPEVDPARTALVGHDYGAMYSAALFAADDRPAALVVMASTARWADWNLRYWHVSDDPEAYRAALAPFDLVTSLAGGGSRPILLQFATLDQYVPAEVADAVAAAAGPSAERRNYETGHELDDAARTDRDAWLRAHL